MCRHHYQRLDWLGRLFLVLLVCLLCVTRLGQGQCPDLAVAVSTGGDQSLAVRMQGDTGYRADVAGQLADGDSIGRIPDANLALVVAGDDQGSIAVEGSRGDCTGQSGQGS